MKTVLLKMFVLLALCSAAAQAQVGIYGTFDYTHYNFAYGNQNVSFNGGGAGVFYDFVHLGPVRAGLDLRGNLQSGGKFKYRSGLAGVRVSIHLPVLPLRPYVQALLGAGGTKSDGPFAAGITGVTYSDKFTYEVLAGADYTLIPHVDFRVLELGYGRQSGVDGSAGNNPSNPLFLLSSGIVVRFP